MKETLLKIENLCREFKLESGTQKILKNISIDIYKGDFTVIMGSSGSGKSTLLYCISGMDNVSSGKVFFGNEELTALDSDKLSLFRRKHCGFVFQQICLVDSLSVLENVLAAGLLTKTNKQELIKKAKAMLNEVEIEDHTFNKYPNQISGGRSQRVGIVRALINEPEVLFADEPTGALNSKTGTDVLDKFTHFNNKGQSIIMVTHDIKSALRGNRILYLKDGVIEDECNLSKYNGSDKDREKKLTDFLGKMGW